MHDTLKTLLATEEVCQRQRHAIVTNAFLRHGVQPGLPKFTDDEKAILKLLAEQVHEARLAHHAAEYVVRHFSVDKP